MTNLEQKALSFGENYNIDRDIYEVAKNFEQHLRKHQFAKMFPDILEDLEDLATCSGVLQGHIAGMAEDIEEAENPSLFALAIASMCVRYAVYRGMEEKADMEAGKE